MSRRKWPWVLLGLVLLTVGVGGGWILKSCTTSEMSSSPPTRTPSAETITVTIGDETVQVGSDQTGHIETGHKGSIKVPDAELEKLARTLRPPSPSWASTWVPPISALLVSLVALGGVILAADKAAKTARETAATERENDARSEWFRRFKEMLDFTFSKDEAQGVVGRTMVGQLASSTLATAEERKLAITVLERIMEPALKDAGVDEPAKPGESDVRFVVEDPPQGTP